MPESLNYRYTGQVGYFTANIRNTKEALVGDTFYLKGEACEPLLGFREAKPLVSLLLLMLTSKEQYFNLDFLKYLV